jgi:hypothetical protein
MQVLTSDEAAFLQQVQLVEGSYRAEFAATGGQTAAAIEVRTLF